MPGVVFGERGFMGGGGAGHELDRADVRLGTPHHALVIGRAVVPDPTYQPVNEERRDHTWPAPREAIIRSDLTFFETPQGGAVFSVGSMNFIGAAAGRRLRQPRGQADRERHPPVHRPDAVRAGLSGRPSGPEQGLTGTLG
ncbi:MAG: N,N-dimethylformamidase beta subunit family domain-containing protein [Acetobacteraceae bacterium]